MKRFVKFIIVMMILCIHIPVFAEEVTKYYYDGQWHTYAAAPTSLQVNGERVEADMPPIIFNDRSVVPARAVFEKLGAEVTWDGDKAQVGISMDDTEILLDIDSTTAIVNGQPHVMEIAAKIINDRTMIPARFVGETLGMEVGWQGGERLITIDCVAEEDATQEDISINHIEHIVDASSVRVVIRADAAIEEYSSFELEEPSRLVLDIENAILNAPDNHIEVDHGSLSNIRAAQFENSPNITRFVLDLKTWTNYDIGLSDDKKELYVDFGSKSNKVTGVVFSKTEDSNRVDIKMDVVQKPNIFRLSHPDRIVIDIPFSQLDIREKKDDIKEDIIQSIRYGQLDGHTARVVIDVGGQPQLELQQRSDGIRLELTHASYENLYYSNKEGPQLTLYRNLNNVDYEEQIDTKNNRYILSVPASDADLGTGRLYINDNHFHDIEIVENEQTEMTDIVFNAKNPYTYTVKPEKNSDRTRIEVKASEPEDIETEEPSQDDLPEIDLDIDPKAKNQIVVVDPGHGGSEPGAVYGGIYERDLNLDISLRLYKMLKGAGVKVYMTRVKDTFVGLTDRPEYANSLNASLFVSIHNNAMENNSGINGTMTYWYPSENEGDYGISRKKLAQIIQTELLRYLDTQDKRVRTNNLAVLTRTKMPSVLVEVGFMSNPQELEKLKQESFRQKAAEALYVGIIKALNESVK